MVLRINSSAEMKGSNLNETEPALLSPTNAKFSIFSEKNKIGTSFNNIIEFFLLKEELTFQKENLQKLKEMISSDKKSKKKINFVDKNGSSLLLEAAKMKNIKLCRIVIRGGGNIGVEDKEKRNVLHYLCQMSEREVEKQKKEFLSLLHFLLFHSSSLIDSPSKPKEETPLHLATLHNNFSAVQTLLKCFANPNCQETSGETPLHIAARLNFLPIQYLLLEYGADTKITGSLSLYHSFLFFYSSILF